jgi:hypothetical protein
MYKPPHKTGKWLLVDRDKLWSMQGPVVTKYADDPGSWFHGFRIKFTGYLLPADVGVRKVFVTILGAHLVELEHGTAIYHAHSVLDVNGHVWFMYASNRRAL